MANKQQFSNSIGADRVEKSQANVTDRELGSMRQSLDHKMTRIESEMTECFESSLAMESAMEFSSSSSKSSKSVSVSSFKASKSGVKSTSRTDQILSQQQHKIGHQLEGKFADSPLIHEFEDDGGELFRFRLDLTDFKPNEVNISGRGNRLLVRAKHEHSDREANESQDYEEREFQLPRCLDFETIKSSFSPDDGMLTVEALTKMLDNKHEDN